MRGQLLKDEFNRSGPVLHLLLRYTQALITQMAQTAVCNRHTRWISSCATGCCSAWIGCRRARLVMTQELDRQHAGALRVARLNERGCHTCSSRGSSTTARPYPLRGPKFESHTGLGES